MKTKKQIFEQTARAYCPPVLRTVPIVCEAGFQLSGNALDGMKDENETW